MIEIMKNNPLENLFEGNIYLFHAFDVGDDINLEKVKASGLVIPQPLTLSKFFKNYHFPWRLKFLKRKKAQPASVQKFKFWRNFTNL